MSSPTPDFPDWSTPTRSVDEAQLLSAVGATLAAGSFIGPFDTSQLSSVTINIAPPSGNGAERMMLSLDWQEGGINCSTDYMTYADLPAYAGALQQLQWQTPVRGGSLYVRARGTNATPQALSVIGSTRTIPGPVMVPRVTGSGGGIGQQIGRLLLAPGSFNLAAGASSQTFYLPPVARAVRLWVGGTFATGYVQINSPEYIAGSMTAPLVAFLDRNNTNQVWDQITVPGMGLEIIVHNSDAALKSANFAFWDVS